jgi:RHS repeat-associated protein
MRYANNITQIYDIKYTYFGSPYYDCDLSIWLSVDPMAQERSWLSPYNYCQWNPVMRIDPSGMVDGWYVDETGSVIGWDGKEGDDLYLVLDPKDQYTVKKDNFEKGVDQSKLRNPVKIPSLEQRMTLKTELYDLGKKDNSAEFGMLIYEGFSSESSRWELFKGTISNPHSDGVRGSVNFGDRSSMIKSERKGGDAFILMYSAHTHNMKNVENPGQCINPSQGADFPLFNETHMIFETNCQRVYIYNNNTKLRINSYVSPNVFFAPFLHNGKQY